MRRALLAAALLTVAAPAAATNAVSSFTGGVAFSFIAGGDATIGWSFSSENDIVVTALGWNVATGALIQGTGGNSSHEVGIWNSSGILLGSTTVTAGEATDGIWRFVDVWPIALSAGQQYFIGGRDRDDDGDGYLSGVTDLVLAAGLTYLGTASSGGTDGFAFPGTLNLFTTSGRFGPNFQFRTVTGAIPEPASWAMMIAGFGLVGAVSRRRAMLRVGV